MHETMAEVGLALTGDEPLQLPLDLDGVVRINQTELIGNTYAVRVRHDATQTEHIAADEVGHLPADTAELKQVLHRLGDFPAELVDERTAAATDVFRFGIVQPDRTDQLLELAFAAFGDAARVRKAFEQRAGDNVDTRVGTLRGQNRHYQQAEWVVVMLERAGNVGIQRFEPFVNKLCFFLLIHQTKNSLPPKAG